MKAGTTKIEKIASNSWFVIIANVATLLGLFLYLNDKLKPESTAIAPRLILGCSGVLYLISFGYSIKIRAHNISLQHLAGIFREINDIYRRSLNEMFSCSNPITDIEELTRKQTEVLSSVCQRIERIFSLATGKQFLASVKLVTGENGKLFVETYVRSQGRCDRDARRQLKFEIGANKNTTFDSILDKLEDDIPYFFSADLSKHEGYKNERDKFLNYYGSMLVVPIAGPQWYNAPTRPEAEVVGFLGVDTKSKNQLNDGYHLQMLSALSHQMFNYISFVRGNYIVSVDSKP